MTIREQIIQAVLSALNTGRPGGVPAAIRSRYHNLIVSALPAVTVFPESCVPVAIQQPRGPLVEWSLNLVVECVAAGDAGMSPDAAVDPLVAWVTKVLGANRFGGLAIRTDEGKTTFQMGFSGQGRTPLCRARVEIQVQYTTRANDAEQAA